MEIKLLSNNKQNFEGLKVNVKALRKSHPLYNTRNMQIKAVNEALPALEKMSKECDIFIKSGKFYDNSNGCVRESILEFKVSKQGDFFERVFGDKNATGTIFGKTTKDDVVRKTQDLIYELNFTPYETRYKSINYKK